MTRLLRGRILSFLRQPQDIKDEDSYVYHQDGGLLVDDGRVAAMGDYDVIRRQAPDNAEFVDHRPHLIMPGFIDPHIHFPQMQVVGSYAANLLEWLNTYTFVEEQRFADAGHAARIAAKFFDELVRYGTTTAVAYCSVHKASADAFFAESLRRNMRMVAGKVMMDAAATMASVPRCGALPWAETPSMVMVKMSQQAMRLPAETSTSGASKLPQICAPYTASTPSITPSATMAFAPVATSSAG